MEKSINKNPFDKIDPIKNNNKNNIIIIFEKQIKNIKDKTILLEILDIINQKLLEFD
tara:strand:- start:470 stop:640 length:171 start_codon:yes stop_codon:yes gene_type:complete